MSEHRADILQLAEEFSSCQKTLQALGDANRQHLILEMMRMEQCGGVRVGTITERTHLSRPAVSHHLHILKDAGILKMRREGTKNYYYFDADADAMNQQKFVFLWTAIRYMQNPDWAFTAKSTLES